MIIVDRLNLTNRIILICTEVGRKKLKTIKKKLRRNKNPTILFEGQNWIITKLEYGKNRIGLHVQPLIPFISRVA